MSIKFKIFFVFILLTGVSICDPVPPIWPNQWQQDFHDIWSLDGQHNLTTDGYYIYDWTNGRQNVYREDCRIDRISSTVYGKEQQFACSQIVQDGRRYLWNHDTNDCCFCCDSAHGCGVLKPEWIQYAGEEWMGYEFIDGQFYNVWRNYDGPRRVYTVYNAETNIQSMIYRPDSGEKQVFDQNSFSTQLDQSRLQFPNNCNMESRRCGGFCFKNQPENQ